VNKSIAINSENAQLMNINSRTDENPAAGEHSLIVRSNYSFDYDIGRFQLNSQVSLNKVKKRKNGTNVYEVLFSNSYRYISPPMTLNPRTDDDSKKAEEAIKFWYQQELSKLESRMTAKREEKKNRLKRTRSKRLKEEVGERSESAKRHELVKLWASEDASQIKNYMLDA
jgi:hypothetical protein